MRKDIASSLSLIRIMSESVQTIHVHSFYLHALDYDLKRFAVKTTIPAATAAFRLFT